MIWIPWHFPLHKDPTIKGSSEQAETALKTRYPALYNHLLAHKENLSKRNKAETGIRYEWYALQRWGSNYWNDFFKPKIVWAEMTKKPAFIFDTNSNFTNQTCYFMNADMYYVSILNSKVIYWYFIKCLGADLGTGAYRWIKQYVEQIPIPDINNNVQNTLSDLADKIQNAEQQNNLSLSTKYQNQIDKILYEYYNFNMEQINIIENLQ